MLGPRWRCLLWNPKAPQPGHAQVDAEACLVPLRHRCAEVWFALAEAVIVIFEVRRFLFECVYDELGRRQVRVADAKRNEVYALRFLFLLDLLYFSEQVWR